MGKVALVGAGPGDVGLITVKGSEYIKAADCIIYDRLIGEDLLMLSKPDCELIYAGKEDHHHVLSQDEINELIAQKAEQSDLVVRLKGGDPYVFGRGGEEALYLRERGIEFEVVPGISSAVAVPAYAGIPVTHRGISKGFHVVTSHSRKDELMDIDFSLYRDEKETCIFLMGLSHVEEIAKELIKAGRSEDTKAAVISNGTQNTQKKCIGTLKDIAARTKESGIASPAIIVVGDVVGLEEELSFFENRPLFGKKYAVPCILSGEFSFTKGWQQRPENGLVSGLKDLGAEVLSFKVGEIKPIQCSLDVLYELSHEDFLIFTSKNAVNAFMWNLDKSHISIGITDRAKIAVVGEKTGTELRRYGLVPHVMSGISTGKALAEELLPLINSRTKVCWLSAREAGRGVEEVLRDRCRFERLPCYENVDLDLCVEDNGMEAIKNMDGLLITSASNANRFYRATGGVLPEKVFSIGPVCTKTLENMGVTDILEADDPSYEELIRLCIASATGAVKDGVDD